MTSLPIDLLAKLYSDQAYYVEKYLPTSEFLDRYGFYKKVAGFVQGGDIIIDMGCGDCKLIYYLKSINKDMTAIGIDINPLMLLIGNDMLTKSGYNVNIHHGINIADDPNTKKLSLISDIISQKFIYNFEKGKINLLQEDFRFGEVLRERLEKDLGLADVITYTIPGGFSPHIILEKGEKDYNSVQTGIETNEHVLALGVELLKDKGKMICALRAGAQNPEKAFHNIDLDGLNLSIFKPYYYINKVEIVDIDEQKLKLDLPAYTLGKKEIYYTNDIRKIKHDFKTVILLIEMIKIAKVEKS